MNEIHTKSRAHGSPDVRDVVAKLIFFLISQYREVGDAGNVLIVAIGFKSRDGAGRGGEWKGQRKTKRSCAIASNAAAGIQNQRTGPCR